MHASIVDRHREIGPCVSTDIAPLAPFGAATFAKIPIYIYIAISVRGSYRWSASCHHPGPSRHSVILALIEMVEIVGIGFERQAACLMTSHICLFDDKSHLLV